jgi:hypothetical protein
VLKCCGTAPERRTASKFTWNDPNRPAGQKEAEMTIFQVLTDSASMTEPTTETPPVKPDTPPTLSRAEVEAIAAEAARKALDEDIDDGDDATDDPPPSLT